MTVYCCARCRIILTFRSPEMRDRQYSFPHSDDFRGCDVCGCRYCESCAAEVGPQCPECDGRLHAGESFPAIGEYRLPPVVRRMSTAEERVAWVGQEWKRGILSRGERRWFLYVIADLAGEAPPADEDEDES